MQTEFALYINEIEAKLLILQSDSYHSLTFISSPVPMLTETYALHWQPLRNPDSLAYGEVDAVVYLHRPCWNKKVDHNKQITGDGHHQGITARAMETFYMGCFPLFIVLPTTLLLSLKSVSSSQLTVEIYRDIWRIEQ